MNKLDSNFAFIQALPSDNHFLTKDYIEALNSIKDKATKERLLYGNWEYDNDPNALIEYDAILDLFTNTHVKKGKTFITADIAMQGSDLFTIGGWEGLVLSDIKAFEKTDGKQVVTALEDLKNETKTPNSRVVYDSDGVGSFVGGFIRNSIAFVNNAKPIKRKSEVLEYQNLKTQCAYLLAKYINDRLIYISAKIDENTKVRIIEELEQLKSYDTDKDGKLKILPKKLIKQHIQRSPDYLDMLLMRMLPELKPPTRLKSKSF